MIGLLEGLQEHDLDFVIMPLISVDEYESKIDDRKAIVVGFFVTEKDPAHDLAAFIEKGDVQVLDTDVSPAPTADGYYMVFVEMDRNPNFPKRLIKLLHEMRNLSNVEDWEFSPLHSKEDENYTLSVEELVKHVNMDPNSIEVADEDEDEEDIKVESLDSFLQHGLFETFSFKDNVLSIVDGKKISSYRVHDFAEGVPSIPLVFDQSDDLLAESSKLQSMLGQVYAVYPTDQHLLITDDEQYLLLSAID
jgi:hypothetical protein